MTVLGLDNVCSDRHIYENEPVKIPLLSILMAFCFTVSLW